MAKKNWVKQYRCPEGGGRVKGSRAKSGACFTIERVQQNGRKGFVTVLHNRATGRKVGYSKAPAAGTSCSTTLDPFDAKVRTKDEAVHAGAQCARKLSVSKKKRAAKKK